MTHHSFISHHAPSTRVVRLLTSLAVLYIVCCTSSLAIAQATETATAQATEETTEMATEEATEEATADKNQSSSHLDLSSNECLQQLNDSDIVIASIAFVDGLTGFSQLKELVKRRPWGVGTPDTADEIKSQLETQSPFLIITLTKKQALTLDDHRDIIRWVLVQSTSKACE